MHMIEGRAALIVHRDFGIEPSRTDIISLARPLSWIELDGDRARLELISWPGVRESRRAAERASSGGVDIGSAIIAII